MATAADRYSDEPKPLGAYVLLMGAFNAGLALAVASAARAGKLPRRFPVGDVVLAGLAAHKLSRLLTKDTVTSPLRAPFARYEGAAGANELEETPRGDGLRRALGELLVCPPCVGLWASAGVIAGLLHAPRVTRTASAVLAVDTVSDFLHLAYAAARDRA